MTLNEFKAWFEGFTESMAGPPDAAQWKRIKARVKEITGNPVTERIFVDRYVEPYRRYFYQSYGTCTAQNGVGNAVLSANAKAVGYTEHPARGLDTTFNSLAAMTELGRAEATSLTKADAAVS
jgi:hypothetical protein